jgi:hypothetical protein
MFLYSPGEKNMAAVMAVFWMYGCSGVPGWHASRFSCSDMPRRTGLVLIVALAALTMYPPPAQVGVRDPQSAAPASTLPAVPKPSVTLEHQLIQVEPMRPPKPAPRLRRALPTTRLAYGPAPQDTLVTRAARKFLGDGRFRPEPFPRLDR